MNYIIRFRYADHPFDAVEVYSMKSDRFSAVKDALRFLKRRIKKGNTIYRGFTSIEIIEKETP